MMAARRELSATAHMLRYHLGGAEGLATLHAQDVRYCSRFEVVQAGGGGRFVNVVVT